MSTHIAPADHAILTQRRVAPPASRFPAYPASWYLFGRADEVKQHPVSKRMLGRDLVAFRTASGRLAILDARCSHLGANLAYGRVSGELIVCPFHNWHYDASGQCTRIPGSAQIPSFARQTAYPTIERHGYLFVFNGAQPLFPLPFFSDGGADDYVAGESFSFTADCPWYVASAHGFDLQHFEAVHDRLMLEPPRIDCPSPFARRNSYRAQVLGHTKLDSWLKSLAGPIVDASITVWGGTFAIITADFDRARSRFLITTQPLENGHTLCEGIVFARRNSNPVVRVLVEHVVLALRRYFTFGYVKDEVSRLRQTRYNPSALIDADHEMAEYFHWLVALPQVGSPADYTLRGSQ
ncbi:MAG: Rieske 2Fe-2S domain-containing protein [bacterium]